MPAVPRAWHAASHGLLLAGTAWMLPHGDFSQPGTAPSFLIGMGMMSLGYLAALRARGISTARFWIVAAGLRIALLVMEPGDDIYRYLWEGRVAGAGINPYLHAPDAPELGPLDNALREKVGHPDCTAIYPPLAETIFAALAGLGAGIAAMKAVFALADLAVCGLLARRFGASRALVYAWNPLVLYCFAGGGHYDSLFILAMVAAWLAWEDNPRRGWQAIALGGIAVALKWMALPIVAWMIWRTWKTDGARRTAAMGAVAAAPLALSWLALSAWTGEWTMRLAPLEFARGARSAELIPALLDAIPGAEMANDVFAPMLLAAWAVAIFRCRRFTDAAEWCFFSLFVLSPMLHAWYFTWLLPFAVLTRNRGAIALNITGALYFIMAHRIHTGDGWTLVWWERAMIWGPFVIGFLLSRRGRRTRSQPADQPPSGVSVAPVTNDAASPAR